MHLIVRGFGYCVYRQLGKRPDTCRDERERTDAYHELGVNGKMNDSIDHACCRDGELSQMRDTP